MRSGPLRVLCVDDDADIRMITVMALGLDTRIDARGVASGAEALALLDAQSWQPDAILLDVMMNGMTGRHCLRRSANSARSRMCP